MDLSHLIGPAVTAKWDSPSDRLRMLRLPAHGESGPPTLGCAWYTTCQSGSSNSASTANSSAPARTPPGGPRRRLPGELGVQMLRMGTIQATVLPLIEDLVAKAYTLDPKAHMHLLPYYGYGRSSSRREFYVFCAPPPPSVAPMGALIDRHGPSWRRARSDSAEADSGGAPPAPAPEGGGGGGAAEDIPPPFSEAEVRCRMRRLCRGLLSLHGHNMAHTRFTLDSVLLDREHGEIERPGSSASARPGPEEPVATPRGDPEEYWRREIIIDYPFPHVLFSRFDSQQELAEGIAPEVRSLGLVGRHSDVWSVAVMALQLLTSDRNVFGALGYTLVEQASVPAMSVSARGGAVKSERITPSHLTSPDALSPVALDFILSGLQILPEDRATLPALMGHAFLAGDAPSRPISSKGEGGTSLRFTETRGAKAEKWVQGVAPRPAPPPLGSGSGRALPSCQVRRQVRGRGEGIVKGRSAPQTNETASDADDDGLRQFRRQSVGGAEGGGGRPASSSAPAPAPQRPRSRDTTSLVLERR